MMETTDRPATSRREIKTPRDIRVAIAEHDAPVGWVAAQADVALATLSGIMHNRRYMPEIIRIRIQEVIDKLDAEEAARQATGKAEEAPRPVRYPRIRRL